MRDAMYIISLRSGMSHPQNFQQIPTTRPDFDEIPVGKHMGH